MAKRAGKDMALPVEDLSGKCRDEVNGASFQNTKWDGNNNYVCIVGAAVSRDEDARTAARHTAYRNGCADIETFHHLEQDPGQRRFDDEIRMKVRLTLARRRKMVRLPAVT
jgi:hypothetical protein